MEEPNISNSQENIQNMNQQILLHIIKPEYLPVGATYESIQDIDKIKDNFYKQIIINDLLDYIDYNEASAVLDSILNKLDKHGEVIVQSIDIKHISSAIVFNDIDIQTAKAVLFNGKRTIYSMNEIENELKNRNLEIIEKKYINIFEYYIRAKK